MTPHRSDLEAAHGRVAALERELAAAKAKARRPLCCTKCRACYDLEDLADGVLTCRGCGANLAIGQPSSPRATRKRPAEVEVAIAATGVRIWWRWQSSSIVLLLFAIAATATLVLATVHGDSHDRIIFLFWLFFAVPITAFLGYRYLAHRRNTTSIEVSPTELSVRHGPIPYAVDKHFPRDAIAQLYVEPRPDSGVTYGLIAVMRNGERVPLVRLAAVERAFYLEQELERVLGLDDRPVAGEVPRT